jgi:hypothetical protein
MFPLFAARFFSEDAPPPAGTATPRRAAPAAPGAAPARGPSGRAGSLRALDLQTLPRDDGPPTELRTRKEKLAFYDQQCSYVGDRLYVSGETVARSRDILLGSSITHVVNCVGFLYPPYFEDDFKYKTLYLQGEPAGRRGARRPRPPPPPALVSRCVQGPPASCLGPSRTPPAHHAAPLCPSPLPSLPPPPSDSPGEDILCILYDVFDFIDSSPAGRVLIHCSQGVSRSTTLAIAYRMWREGRGYDEVFAEVKGMRGVANPNIGFICQLLQWQKRRAAAGGAAAAPRLYRVAPQSQQAPLYLVPKMAPAARPAALDPRGAFVLHDASAPPALFLWLGAQCPEALAAAGRRAAEQLQRYEEAPPAVEVEQGREPAAFWAAFGCAGGATPPPPRQVPEYDREYETYARAAVPGSARGGGAGGETCDSARSGRKTPRACGGAAATSPNDRLRKQARSELLERERKAGGGEVERPFTVGSARARQLEYEKDALRRQATASHAGGPARPALTPRRAEEAAAPSPLGGARGGRPPAVPKLSLSTLQAAPIPAPPAAAAAAAQQQGEAAAGPAPGRRPPPVPRLNLRG